MNALSDKFGLSEADIIIMVAALGVFATVLALSFATTRDNRLAARIAAVSGNRQIRAVGAKRSGPTGKAAMLSMMHKTVSRLNLMRSNQAKQASIKLAGAGWRSKDALVIYLFARLSLPLLSGGGAAIAIYGMEVVVLKPIMEMFAVMGCVLLSFVAPNVVIKNMRDKRRKALQKQLPDALDLMVICTEAGLSLDATMQRMVREITSTSKELADELMVTSSELNFLGDRQKALDNLKERVDLGAIHALCTTLMQTEKFGTPLAQALRLLAQEQRDERMLRAEEKAARLPAIMTIPLIVFILPALFVVVLGPAILAIMDALVKM